MLHASQQVGSRDAVIRTDPHIQTTMMSGLTNLAPNPYTLAYADQDLTTTNAIQHYVNKPNIHLPISRT